MKAFTQLKSFEGRGSMEGWLTRIATNTCLNLIRSAKRRPESTVSDLTDDENRWLDAQLSDVGSEPRHSVEQTLIAADLADRVLNVLSPEDQMALLMMDGEDASVKEVAEATGWSESKVKVRAFRARKKVREAMERLLGPRKGGAVGNEG
jgi:RNA polymerase sigma-70 factor (ECF subfamily)